MATSPRSPSSPSSLAPIRRVVLVHAMRSTLDDHWYRAFIARLEPHCAVVAPAMPTPFEPNADAWQAALVDTVGAVDEATVIVAHSVGNAAALRYLTSLGHDWLLGGLVNVAGFADPQPGNDATIPFTRGIDTDLVRQRTARRHAIISGDDPEVPERLTSALAARLDSVEHHVARAGHFRGADGYTAFPLLERLVLGWADQIVATEPESTR